MSCLCSGDVMGHYIHYSPQPTAHVLRYKYHLWAILILAEALTPHAKTPVSKERKREREKERDRERGKAANGANAAICSENTPRSQMLTGYILKLHQQRTITRFRLSVIDILNIQCNTIHYTTPQIHKTTQPTTPAANARLPHHQLPRIQPALAR